MVFNGKHRLAERSDVRFWLETSNFHLEGYFLFALNENPEVATYLFWQYCTRYLFFYKKIETPIFFKHYDGIACVPSFQQAIDRVRLKSIDIDK